MNRVKHYLKEIALFIVVMTIFANIISLYKSSELNQKPLMLNSVTLIDNMSYQLDNNKPILVHFWATWCPTCKLEAGNIDLISKHYNVLTIAVNSGSNSDIQHYLKEHNYNYNVVNDKDGTLSQKFKIAAFPTTFIYDKKHRLKFSEVGYTSTLGLYLRLLWASL